MQRNLVHLDSDFHMRSYSSICVIYPYEGHSKTEKMTKKEIKDCPKLVYYSCRFNFPKFPMNKTSMLEPHLDQETDEYKKAKGCRCLQGVEA